MKQVYKYEGKGFYIGSVVIVSASDKTTAINLINEELKKIGLSEEVATEENVVWTKSSLYPIIYSTNGDY